MAVAITDLVEIVSTPVLEDLKLTVMGNRVRNPDTLTYTDTKGQTALYTRNLLKAALHLEQKYSVKKAAL